MLIVTIAALLAGGDVLPEIDRPSLARLARIEARRAVPPAARPARPAPARPAPARPALLVADARAVTDLCRAARSQRDPARFLAGLQAAFNLSAAEAEVLRSACRSYQPGRVEAGLERRNPPGFSGQAMPRATRLSTVVGM